MAYSFTPIEISTENLNMQKFSYENNTKTSHQVITDINFYNTIQNFLSEHFEIVNNFNIKGYTSSTNSLTNPGSGTHNILAGTMSAGDNVQFSENEDYILPICLYNNNYNYYIAFGFPTSNTTANLAYGYIILIYPDTKNIFNFAWRLNDNTNSKTVLLYNINNHIFIISNGIYNQSIVSAQGNLIFYEDYCLSGIKGNTHPDIFELSNRNQYCNFSQPISYLSPLTNNLTLVPLYYFADDKKFDGIYSALYTFYNNQAVTYNGIDYLVLPRSTNTSSTLINQIMNFVISSEVCGN